MNKTTSEQFMYGWVMASSYQQLTLSKILSIFIVIVFINLATISTLTEQTLKMNVRVRRSYDVSTTHRTSKSSGKENSNVTGKLATGGSNDRSSIFVTENSTSIMAQVGGTATLPCVVRKFSSGVVSWIRREDYHLLTVGLATYSSDGRFLVEHVRHLQNWALQIKYVQARDAGMYECQVSTHPPTSIFIHLIVTEVTAEILGSPDLHIKSGSTLKLVCKLRQSTEAPVYVFWYHEDRMINYDSAHGVSVHSDKSSSVLTIQEAKKNDNGNYTCMPSNAKPASINVHVLNATAGEQPAAMQHANSSSSSTTIHCCSFTRTQQYNKRLLLIITCPRA
ncbi:transmembrane and immunoglobulin domain-containing protein 1-like [Chrysoperla carnea]|uniref:transmembrane and immunoglobulin domain-containing protein 1-like n=1 Tax=Chrysoperla carnea TaxID=189513 RepID=UPI001D082488|nr:transmembrane and immunoglobulin domain-containing protein 1-like [Chrysoperla carnea]